MKTENAKTTSRKDVNRSAGEEADRQRQQPKTGQSIGYLKATDGYARSTEKTQLPVPKRTGRGENSNQREKKPKTKRGDRFPLRNERKKKATQKINRQPTET